MICYLSLLFFTILLFVLLYYFTSRRSRYLISVSKDFTSRELGRHEYFYQLRYITHAVQTCAVYVLESSLSLCDDNVRLALQALAARHPLLRMRIREEPARSTAYFEEIPDFDVDYCQSELLASKRENWKTLYSREVHQLTNHLKGPHWRVCRMKEEFDVKTGKYTNCFLFTVHHGMCDGTSRIVLLREFLEHLDAFHSQRDLNLEPLQLLPPYETYLVDALDNGTSLFKTFYTDIMTRLQARGFFLPPLNQDVKYFFDRYPPVSDIYPSIKHQSKILFRIFNSNETQKLLAVCRRQSCSLTGAINAAVCMAMAEILENGKQFSPSEISCYVCVNLRKHSKILKSVKNLDQSVGLYFGSLSIRCRIPSYDKLTSTQVFWSVARQSSQKIRDGIANSDELGLIRSLYKSLSRWHSFRLSSLLETRHKCNRFSPGILSVSNNGCIDTPPGKSIFHLSKVFAAVNESSIGCLFSHNIMTVNGELIWTCFYSANLTTSDLANGYFDKACTMLMTSVQLGSADSNN